jgi:hypothetical protein
MILSNPPPKLTTHCLKIHHNSTPSSSWSSMRFSQTIYLHHNYVGFSTRLIIGLFNDVV